MSALWPEPLTPDELIQQVRAARSEWEAVLVLDENRARPLQEILDDYQRTSLDYVRELGSLTDVELNDPARWPGMPSGRRPWRILYDPKHYAHHASDIEEWLARGSDR